ncbi:hypothetical protein ACHAWF_012971 [Thalassiosira exigua]
MFAAAAASRSVAIAARSPLAARAAAAASSAAPASSPASSSPASAPEEEGGDDPPPPLPRDPAAARLRALSLYREILRGASKMPTPNRRNFVVRKARAEFRKHAALTDPDEIEFQLRLADTNLDTVLVQAEHLTRLFNDPEYQNYN